VIKHQLVPFVLIAFVRVTLEFADHNVLLEMITPALVLLVALIVIPPLPPVLLVYLVTLPVL